MPSSKEPATRDDALRLLQSGPAGVAAWNAFRERIRSEERRYGGTGQIFYTYQDGFGSVRFDGYDLREAILDGVYLRGASFRRADLRGASLKDTCLEYADFTGADLRDVNFELARLTNAVLCGARLDNAYLYRAHMNGANFRDASLVGADLRVIQMKGAQFQGANLTDIRLPETASSWYSESVLDLATAKGLDQAIFPQLQSYISEVAGYLAKGNTHELSWDNEKFFQAAVKQIDVLVQVYGLTPLRPEHAEVLRAIREAKRDPQSLYSLDPRAFEQLVAEVLASFGFKVRLTAKSKDGGYDIFAVSQAGEAPLESAWIIECKRYAPERRVGISEVRELYAVKGEVRVPKALLATTSSFTRGSKEFALSRYDLELVDFKALIDWINRYSPHPQGKLHLEDSRLLLPRER